MAYRYTVDLDMTGHSITNTQVSTTMSGVINVHQMNVALSGYTVSDLSDTNIDIDNILSTGDVLQWDDNNGYWINTSVALAMSGVVDHSSLVGLLDDDHTQYIRNTPSTTLRNTIDPVSDIVPLTIHNSYIEGLTSNLTDWKTGLDVGLVVANVDYTGKGFFAGVDAKSSEGTNFLDGASINSVATVGQVNSTVSGYIPLELSNLINNKVQNPINTDGTHYHADWDHFRSYDTQRWESATEGSASIFIDNPNSYSYFKSDGASCAIAITPGSAAATAAGVLRWKEQSRVILYDDSVFGIRLAHNKTTNQKIRVGFGDAWVASGVGGTPYIYAEFDSSSSSSWQLKMSDGTLTSQATSTTSANTVNSFKWFIFQMSASGVALYIESGVGTYDKTTLEWNGGVHPSTPYGGMFMQHENSPTNWIRLQIDQAFMTSTDQSMPSKI